MKVNFGPVETEVTALRSGTIMIEQRVHGDDSDKAYSSLTLTPENAEAVALEILRLISASRAKRF